MAIRRNEANDAQTLVVDPGFASSSCIDVAVSAVDFNHCPSQHAGNGVQRFGPPRFVTHDLPQLARRPTKGAGSLAAGQLRHGEARWLAVRWLTCSLWRWWE